jgi:hypothetical protein
MRGRVPRLLGQDLAISGERGLDLARLMRGECSLP